MTHKILPNNHALIDQTIVALCTPQGPGALALIRLSGIDAFMVADLMSKLASSKKISQCASHTIEYGWVIGESADRIDQVLFLIMAGPRTFTGQDVVEITCHNNPFLIERIIDRALACGARLARNGEFCERAVMLGKIDLLQAEAIYDLIHAQSSESLKYSLSQLEGSFSHTIAAMEQAVLEMIAFCEGSFEFLDEEMEFAPEISGKLSDLTFRVEKILKTMSKQQIIKQGVRIALIGSTNVGKSSLFNALLDQKRAIVTPVAGTTRDSIEAVVVRQGSFITLIDTAGIRSTGDVIEREGIDRSFYEAAQADIILLVFDHTQELADTSRQAYQEIMQKYASKIIVVKNKIDVVDGDVGTNLSLNFEKLPLSRSSRVAGVAGCIEGSKDTSPLFLLGLDAPVLRSFGEEGRIHEASTHQPETIDKLFLAIDQKIVALKGSDEVVCLLSKRQHDLLVTFLQNLKIITPMLAGRVDYELVSCRLQEALVLLAQMTGRSVSQKALDQVFQSFCVGK